MWLTRPWEEVWHPPRPWEGSIWVTIWAPRQPILPWSVAEGDWNQVTGTASGSPAETKSSSLSLESWTGMSPSRSLSRQACSQIAAERGWSLMQCYFKTHRGPRSESACRSTDQLISLQVPLWARLVSSCRWDGWNHFSGLFQDLLWDLGQLAFLQGRTWVSLSPWADRTTFWLSLSVLTPGEFLVLS